MLIEAIPQLVWTTWPDGLSDYFNTHWYNYTGLTPEQSLGDGWIMAVHPDDAETTLAMARESLATGNTYQTEYRLRQASTGEFRAHLVRALPLKDSTGKILRWFGTCTDIHDQKVAVEQQAASVAAKLAYEEEKKRSVALAELDKAKTDFFSSVSHEFRTPLTLMLSSIEDSLGDSDSPLPVEHRERHEVVRRNGIRLLKLVNTLLDFSRIEAKRTQLSLTPVNLSALTAELASSFESAALAGGVEMIVDCPPLPALVFVDQDLWEKIVLNLISNAFKFTFSGSIRIALVWKGDWVDLTVEDTGTGIPEKELPRIFERFYRVERAVGRTHEGTGIGLALVQELVKLHSGRVAVKSEVGKGSCFTVSFPTGTAHLAKIDCQIKPAPSPRSETNSPSFLAETLQWYIADMPQLVLENPPIKPQKFPWKGDFNKRILIVDDNADIRIYLTRLLSAFWSVKAVSEGIQALAAFQNEPPDLVISDVMMPKMNGLELVQTLRANEKTCTTPLILLSARAGEEAIIAGLESGADEYIIKPFSANELLSRVRALLWVSQLRNEAVQMSLKQAEQSQKLLIAAQLATHAREEILAVMSHDLRTPLSSIKMASEMLNRSLGGDGRNDRALHQIEIMRRNALRMERLVGDLLDVASIDSGSLSLLMEPHTVGELVRENEEIFGPQAAEKDVKLIISINPEMPPVSCDKDRILQVLFNLVGNAVKFTPRGGTVRVQADYIEDATKVLFKVTDTGPGIPLHAQARVFDRYWHQAQHRRDGHGLGLAISKGIVESHGGALELEASSDTGSVFAFWLPVQEPTSDSPANTGEKNQYEIQKQPFGHAEEIPPSTLH